MAHLRSAPTGARRARPVPRRRLLLPGALLAVLALLLGMPASEAATTPSSTFVTYSDTTPLVTMYDAATSLSLELGSHSVEATVDPDQTARSYLTNSSASGTYLPGSIVSVPNDPVSGSALDPATSDCLAKPSGWSDKDWYAQGRNVACANGDRTVTLTFDPPVVDPVVLLQTSAMVNTYTDGSDPTTCWFSYHDFAVTQVNGTDSSGWQLDLVGEQHTYVESFVDGAVTHLVEDGTCNPWSSTNSQAGTYMQVTGLVSSITITAQQHVEILRQGSWGGLWGWGATARTDWSGISSSWTQYILKTSTADLAITKQGSTEVVAGNEVEWSLEVSNLGPAPSHGYLVHDAVPEQVTDVALVSAPDGCTLSGLDLLCTAAPAGWEMSDGGSGPPQLSGGDAAVDVPVVLASGATAGTIVLRGTATGDVGDAIVNTATVAGVDHDASSANNSASLTTTIVEPGWSVAKSVEGGEAASPGDVLTYTVEASSTGSTDVTGVTLTDDLTSVLAAADIVPGSVRLTVGSGTATVLTDPTVDDPVIVAGPFILPAGSTATLTYQATVRDDAYSALLTNTVAAAGDSPPGTCATGADDVCSTATRVTARLEVLKQGTVNGSVVALDGAQFEVLDDDAGSAGAARADLAVQVVTGSTGLFEVAGIAPGTYWLRETQAPDGHGLLADAVQFVVAADGQVTMSDPEASTQVVAVDGRLTVTDSPTFDLPVTGGSGTGWLLTLGWVLLGVCVVLATGLVLHGRRRQASDGERSAIDS
ncbi:MAG TPA: SpaA isopeptide-forming pilin-related protein [Cellulomonas sp.]